MRHLTRIGLLVVLQVAMLPAQDAPKDLARAIQLEDQEHDLAKAEAMYRKLLADGAPGAEQKAQLELRLGRLLLRLGKTEEAKPLLERAAAAGGDVGVAATKALQGQGQDGERLKELRAQARVLVQKALAQPQQGSSDPNGIYGVADFTVGANLLWIGAAAVPEIVAALEPLATELRASSRLPEGHEGRDAAMTGLMGLLWKYGGKEAEQFLGTVVTNGNVELRTRCVLLAHQLERPEMLALAERFLSDPDPAANVQATLLDGGLFRRIPATDIVAAAVHGSQAMKALALNRLALYWPQLNHTIPAASTLDQVLPLVREALASTDPGVGRRGQEFLLSQAITTSPGGVELLLREFPKLNVPGRQPVNPSLPPGIDAKEMLPHLLAAARAIGAVPDRNPSRVPERQKWLGAMAVRLLDHDGADALPAALELMDLGYDVAAGGQLGAWLDSDPPRVRTEQAEAVFARLERVLQAGRVLRALARVDLPASLWPQLRAKAEEFERNKNDALELFLEPMARTGVPEAATWLLDFTRRHFDRRVCAVQALLDLGMRTQAEPVKAAMRTLLLDEEKQLDLDLRGRLFLALASMGDTAMFDELHFENIAPYGIQHPYGPHQQMTPTIYLLQENVDPPIGLTRAQVLEAIRAIARKDPAFFVRLNSAYLTVPAIPNDVLGEVVRQVLIGMSRSEEGLSPQQRNALQQARSTGQQMLAQWLNVVTQRLTDKEHPSADLLAWVERCLGDKNADLRLGVLKHIYQKIVPLLQKAIEARLEDEDERCAGLAANLLVNAHVADDDKWLQRLLQNHHATVRTRAVDQLAPRLGDAVQKLVLPALSDRDPPVRLAACKYFAGIVSKDAVPELLTRLKDDDETVRTAAADALQKIRFYQEQQAHWDRILKGVDASAGTATEKLLAQAKPGQPKEQRVLAIQSLAALGAPEALPFLIEWLGDQDADVAAAARAAVGSIHQRAGVK